jgi:ABC-type nitrate/sulfonate/bicarbonate transport system substrate-binding protein
MCHRCRARIGQLSVVALCELILGVLGNFFSVAQAQEQFRVSYGGYNETAAPMWVGIERGFFKKYGIDASMIQVRSGALSVATLLAKEVDAVWPAQSTILSTVSGGVKLTCIAGPVNKIPRNLMVRKEVKSTDDLRGKTVGVQSIGGGLWLQTMIILDHLGVDPDKYGIKVRVIGDEATLAQAMITNNIDFGVITYGLSETLYAHGFRSLVDAGDISAPYQGPEICGLKESVVGRNEVYLRVTKGLAEAVAYILDDNHKSDVTKVLARNLRLSRNDVIEGSYRVLRKMTTLDMAPNVAAFKSVQRIVARINPKITQVDLDQIIDTSFMRQLESSGFLAELRKKQR